MFISVLICFVVLSPFTLINSSDTYNDSLSESLSRQYGSYCGPRRSCLAPQYRCDTSNPNPSCVCGEKFTLDDETGICVACPLEGEACKTHCCPLTVLTAGDETLHCRSGQCQRCVLADDFNTLLCHENINNQLMFISATQIAMATALIMGILATFILLYKLCAKSSVRGMNRSMLRRGGRPSVDSLQRDINRRLRDAPPRYSRAPPAAMAPAVFDSGLTNLGFVHDSSVPPPAYSTVVRNKAKNQTEEKLEKEDVFLTTSQTDGVAIHI